MNYEIIGKIFVLIAEVSLISVSLLMLTWIINKAVWSLIDCYGGMVTFHNYVTWYHKQKKESEADK